jgi:asparaginyl-tRNA synthetase
LGDFFLTYLFYKKAKGLKLLHEFAIANLKKEFLTFGDDILKYVVAGTLSSSKQLKAAIKYFQKEKELDTAKLEPFCGVGVEVSEDEIKAVVATMMEKHAQLLEDKQWHALGPVMKAVSGELEWANGVTVKNLVHAALEAKLGPQKSKAEKKAKEVVVKKVEEVIVENPNTPFSACRVHEAAANIGKRVLIKGWVHELRVQSKMVFLVVRDAGSGFIQVLLAGKLAKTKAAQTLRKESSVYVYGTISKVPEGQRAEGGVEVQADYFEVFGAAMDDIEQAVNKDCSEEIKSDQRHLLLRGRKASAYLRLRALAMHAMRCHFMEQKYYEVTPPTMVQTSCEGGSDLFSFDFFGEKAYLTQSSQLYLETVCPSVGKTFCILPSFRAEKSRTRRHLAEYTHLEAELPWITFEDLLNAMEDLIVNTIERMMAIPEAKELLLSVNPDFKVPQRPFRRMSYTDAVKYCNEHNITKNDDTGKPTDEHYAHGDDLPEAAERAILADLNEPIFMYKFPVHLKAFYMSKTKEDDKLTESVDLLLPGVGEVIGGSMRIHDYEELMAAYKREGYDASPYYWYTDQRKYGTFPHGGYGLGIERFLVYIFGDDHIRNVCLYPRYKNRCTP